MESALRTEQHDPRHKARFDVLRQKIFGEMGRASARWRLTWLLPFHVAVLVLLVVRHEPAWRAEVQGVAIVVSSTLFVLQAVRPSDKLTIASFFAGTASLFVSIAVTGGLASPLLVTGVMILSAAGIVLHEPRWLKPLFFGFYIAGGLALALLSRTSVGELAAPLTPVNGWSSAEYVTIALMSVAFVAMGSFRTGCHISRAYERVALELAERREELCTENEDRTRALEGIAARLAHEVKNPLAAIKGLSTHMARSSADPKVAERLAIVAAEADRLQGIVDGFLSFSRGFDELKVAPTNPHEIARELSLLLETRAADQGVALQVTGPSDLTVNADARKLRQALLNLVLNAMQASPEGSTVRVVVARGISGLSIKVKDEGAGMTPEVLERIRKPYFTTKEGGSGLGVAVARGLIEQHGGQLGYESAPGRGTVATIELPWCSRKMCKSLPNPLRPQEKVAPGAAVSSADVTRAETAEATAR